MLKYYSGKPDYFEQLSLNNVVGKKFDYKFGRNSSVGATEVIIASGGIYGLPLTSQTISCISDDIIDDLPLGDGARSIHLYGLDINYSEIDEIVEIGDTSIKEFLRVDRAMVETSGTVSPIGGGNVGTITMSQSISGIDMIIIDPNVSQSLCACFTIPSGFIGHVWSADTTTGEGKNATNQLKAKPYGLLSPFTTKGIRDNFENSVGEQFKIPLIYEEKTDIVFTALSTASGTPVSATFLIELTKIEP